jgi:hypothetical protein
MLTVHVSFSLHRKVEMLPGLNSFFQLFQWLSTGQEAATTAGNRTLDPFALRRNSLP